MFKYVNFFYHIDFKFINSDLNNQYKLAKSGEWCGDNSDCASGTCKLGSTMYDHRCEKIEKNIGKWKDSCKSQSDCDSAFACSNSASQCLSTLIFFII